MPQSLAAVYLHLIFSTKHRLPFLKDREVRLALHAYLGGICKELDCTPILVGGVEDHVHILAKLSRTTTIADWVKELKRVSNLWLKQHGTAYEDFEWQGGYSVFSVSQSMLAKVRDYVAGQEEHHKAMGYEQELRALLGRHELEWDERYVWE